MTRSWDPRALRSRPSSSAATWSTDTRPLGGGRLSSSTCSLDHQATGALKRPSKICSSQPGLLSSLSVTWHLRLLWSQRLSRQSRPISPRRWPVTFLYVLPNSRIISGIASARRRYSSTQGHGLSFTTPRSPICSAAFSWPSIMCGQIALRPHQRYRSRRPLLRLLQPRPHQPPMTLAYLRRKESCEPGTWLVVITNALARGKIIDTPQVRQVE